MYDASPTVYTRKVVKSMLASSPDSVPSLNSDCHYPTQNTEYGRGSIACGWHSPRHVSTPQRICSSPSRAGHHCREKATDKRSPRNRVPFMAARISESRETSTSHQQSVHTRERKEKRD